MLLGQNDIAGFTSDLYKNKVHNLLQVVTNNILTKTNGYEPKNISSI